jgi:hypothetical protein
MIGTHPFLPTIFTELNLLKNGAKPSPFSPSTHSKNRTSKKKGLNIFLLPTKVTFFAFPFLQITKLRVLEFAETEKWTFDKTTGLKTYLTRNRKYM